MPLGGYERQPERRFLSRRGLVVLLTSFALAVVLASRVYHAGFFNAPAAYSSSSTAKIQHLDNDASQWVAPAATFALLWDAESESALILDADDKIPVRLPDDSLHNRPPPAS